MSYLFYGGDSDNKEEGQAAGDRAGGGVDDKLQREKERCGGGEGKRMPSNAMLSKEVQQGEASVIRNQASILRTKKSIPVIKSRFIFSIRTNRRDAMQQSRTFATDKNKRRITNTSCVTFR